MAPATPIDANSSSKPSIVELPSGPSANDNASTDEAATTVTLSASAAKRICQIVSKEPASNVLRLAVLGGGCSGFSYEFGLEDAAGPDDLVITRDGAQMVVDIVSLPYLEGSEVDFVDDLIGQSFQVKNPNATASCGCGTSFSI